MDLLPVTPMAPPGRAAEVRAHERMDGRREREGGAVHSRPPGSQLHVQLGRQRRGRTMGSWTQQQSTPAHGPVRTRWPLGATPGALPAFALRPAAVWAAATRGLSVSGALLSLCGMGHSGFHRPRHMRRGKTNSPAILHHLAWPCVGLPVTQAAASAGSLYRAQPSPCPVHSRQQCVPSC